MIAALLWPLVAVLAVVGLYLLGSRLVAVREAQEVRERREFAELRAEVMALTAGQASGLEDRVNTSEGRLGHLERWRKSMGG